MTRELKLAVGIHECDVETFGENEVSVRVTHQPSGATGESIGERTQVKNKKQAFRRMMESAAFARWVKEQQK